MAKRKPRRRGRRFHWIAADHVARMRYLLNEGRLKDHDLYWRLYQQELRATIKGREPWPPDHPVFAYLFGDPVPIIRPRRDNRTRSSG